MLDLALHVARHQGGLAFRPLPSAEALLVGLGAAVAVVLDGIWRLAQHVTVIAHEGSHALVGSAAGARVDRVHLRPDGTGETITVHRAGRGAVPTLFIGYLGPSAFGLAAAKLIVLGYAGVVLWLAVILLAVLLLSVRTAFGVLSVVATGVALFMVVRSRQAGLETVAAYGLAWFLLLSGVRVVLVHRTGALDARKLRERTSVPRTVWFALWAVGAAAALWTGAALLL